MLQGAFIPFPYFFSHQKTKEKNGKKRKGKSVMTKKNSVANEARASKKEF